MGAGRSAGAVAFRARLPPLALAPPPPPPVPPSPPPHPLKARYDWASRTLLGSGQHGIVNLVRVRADGSLVAVKTVIKPAHDHPDRERVLAIIHREATLMKMLPEGTASARWSSACKSIPRNSVRAVKSNSHRRSVYC